MPHLCQDSETFVRSGLCSSSVAGLPGVGVRMTPASTASGSHQMHSANASVVFLCRLANN